MIEFLLYVSVLPALLIVPGWFWARQRQPQSVWLFCLPLAGDLLWLALETIGLGPSKSLTNVIEVFAVTGMAIIAAYLKFFVFDRIAKMRSLGAIIAIIIVATVTICLYLLVPSLPE